MRLIDADALSEVMYHEAFEKDTDMQKWDSGCWIRYKMFENCINAAPTVDPVRHGRWIKVDKHTVKCSKCGNYLDKRGVNAGRGDALYCPNCGAKMDEERKEK